MAKGSGGTRQRSSNTSTESNLKNDFRKDILNSEEVAELERNSDYYKGSRTALAKELKGLYKEAVDTVKDAVNNFNLESVEGVYNIETYYRERLSSLNSKISDKIEALRYNADRGYANKTRAEQAVSELYSLKRNIDNVGKKATNSNNLQRLNEVLIKKGKWK